MHLFHSELSCSQAGLLQRASPLSKAVLLIITLFYISTRASANSVWPVVVILLSLITLSNIRLYKVVFLLVLPLGTALLFAAYTMHDQELVFARSTAGVLVAIMFFFTTPSNECMAMLSPFLPNELADGLFLTYRSLFVIGGRVSEALRGLELRGLYRPKALVSNAKVLGGVVGNVLCDALDSAERMGQVMALRGVSGSIAPRGYKYAWSWWDVIPFASAALVLLLLIGGAA